MMGGLWFCSAAKLNLRGNSLYFGSVSYCQSVGYGHQDYLAPITQHA